MVQVSNFSGLLEIAFAVNAVYFFEIRNNYLDDIQGEMRRLSAVGNEKRSAGLESERRWGAGIAWLRIDQLLGRISLLLSLLSLAILLVGANYPEIELWTWFLNLLVILSIVVPVISHWMLNGVLDDLRMQT